MEWMGGKLACVIDWSASTILCNFLGSWAVHLPKQAAMSRTRMLSIMHLYKLVRDMLNLSLSSEEVGVLMCFLGRRISVA